MVQAEYSQSIVVINHYFVNFKMYFIKAKKTKFNLGCSQNNGCWKLNVKIRDGI